MDYGRCCFYQSDQDEERAELMAGFRNAALENSMIYAELSMNKDENISDSLWLIKSALRTMEASFHGRLIQSLPEILVAAPWGFQDIQIGALREIRLACPGFKDAMIMALEGGRLTKPQWSLLSRFLQGESIDSENFENMGLAPLTDGLDRYNALQVAQTVVQGLNVLGFNGILLALNEKESVFGSRVNSLRDRRTADQIRRLVEFCVGGRFSRLTLIWMIMPGFLETCADLRPDLESKLFVMPGRKQIGSERWPIMSVKDALASKGLAVYEGPAAVESERGLNALEALRYGMVPEQDLWELTQGMDDFRTWALRCLSECQKAPNGFEIAGRAGEGKTHSLALIRRLAREKGFLTLSVSLNGQGNVSFTNPVGFIRELWRSIGPGQDQAGTPLLDLHRKANESNVRLKDPFFCDLLKRNLNVIRKLTEKGRIDQYAGLIERFLTAGERPFPAQNIEAEDSALLLIQNPAVKRDAKEHETLLDSLGYYANLAQIAGLSGLVVTVDGFETEYRGSDRYSQLVQTLNVFGSYFRKELELPRVPLGLFVSRMERGSEWPADMVREMIAVTASHVWKLNEWDSDRRVRLAEKIQNIYCHTYQWMHEFDEGFVSSVEKAIMGRLGAEAGGAGLSSALTCFIKIFMGILDTEAVK
jgi:hypothetical protein